MTDATDSYSPAISVLAALCFCAAALFARLRATRALVPVAA